MNGIFIAFEGCEGSGKTSAIKALKQKYTDDNVIFLREPGGTVISEEIRNVILNPETPEMFAETEALLFAASRTQLVNEKILPLLKQGKIIVCDRFIESSLAYQGAAGNIAIEKIKSINDFGIDSFRPDYTFFFDITPYDSMTRIKKRDIIDRIEQKELDFHNKVYDYLKQESLNNDSWISINAAQPLDNMIDDVLKEIDKLI